MTVYEAIQKYAPGPGVFVYIEMTFSQRVFKFYSHDLEKMMQSKEFRECINLQVKRCIPRHALCMLDITAAYPGTEIFDYKYNLKEEEKNGFKIGKSINHNNKVAEFACRVCHRKMKKENPGMIDCAWRGIDNEYCPELLEELEKFAHENRY